MPISPTLLAMTIALILISAASVRAVAQNGKTKTNSNTGQAALNITALVVPTVLLPPAQSSKPQGEVIYNVPTRAMPLSMTQELRPLPGNLYPGHLSKDAVLQTVTVVPQ
jgi:hypothetical protein